MKLWHIISAQSAVVGAAAGFSGYLALAIAIERAGDGSGQVLSYGQQAALFSLPLCTFLGAAIGLSLSLAVLRRYAESILVALIAGLGGCVFVMSSWMDQINRYGRDPSEMVLYYPPLAASALALLVGAASAVARARREKTASVECKASKRAG
ncbi:hypothetical protein [Botrimarina sp.]|uniref:hypothetical protein n=1 Tax=Botrimarina sp. TaxID=2795802 RepID=UPI0032ECFA6F